MTMTTELVELAERMRTHYASMRDYELDRRQRETRASCASAMQQVCAAMAGSAMVGAVFIKDPKEAAKSFDDSMRWQVAGALASLGDPKIVSEYLSNPPAAPEPGAVWPKDGDVVAVFDCAITEEQVDEIAKAAGLWNLSNDEER